MSSYVITGASRGLGLELARQLVAAPSARVVFATVRAPSAALDEIAAASAGKVVVLKLETTDAANVAAVAADIEARLGGKGLDVLINNAASFDMDKNAVEMDHLVSSFTTNVVGTHNITRALIPLLRKGHAKKIINISSAGGSLTLARATRVFPVPAYKISKAALNALTVQLALALEDEGFTVASLSPGVIKSEYGGDNDVDVVATAMLAKIEAVSTAQNGQFLHIAVPGFTPNAGTFLSYDGANLPW
ncbi:hypothetical protein Q5752_001887 [Cryptotrichosporon argae]